MKNPGRMACISLGHRPFSHALNRKDFLLQAYLVFNHLQVFQAYSTQHYRQNLRDSYKFLIHHIEASILKRLCWQTRNRLSHKLGKRQTQIYDAIPCDLLEFRSCECPYLTLFLDQLYAVCSLPFDF